MPQRHSPDSIDYHILSTSTLTDDRIRVLKSNDLFAVFNRFGDIQPHGLDSVHGLYLADMRYVSLLKLRLAGCHPLFLSSTVKENNALMTVDLTNPDMDINDVRLPADTVHIMRTKFLLDNTCYERIRLHNFGKQTITLPITLHCAGDFADIFELRGNHREFQGTYGTPECDQNSITYTYLGLDDLRRQTTIRFSPSPDNITVHPNTRSESQINNHLDEQIAHFTAHLEPGDEIVLHMTIHCRVHDETFLDELSDDLAEAITREIADDQASALAYETREVYETDPSIDQTHEQANEQVSQEIPPPEDISSAIPLQEAPPRTHREALHQLIADAQHARQQASEIISSNDLFNRWIARSEADLYMLTTRTTYGPYPYAGTPWYSTVFGRDGLITAYQTLWNMPNMARGVLAFLAAHQATEFNDDLDSEPGKIIHEMRRSEMALTTEVPFRHYYGSIDSTPLFIWLAGAYYERTADLTFIESLWPAIERAVTWMDIWGQQNGNGYLVYNKRAEVGLLQQGWKDSEDSIFHTDGTIAPPPIALCEVQAYAYGARLAAARIADVLGHEEFATIQRSKAETLRIQFERDFWCEELGLYALAIDGNGRKSQVRSSNPGHCLLTGIASPERARRIADSLMHPDFYSGWGIRTLARGEARYNPLSYHNGSIWPHDNSLIAAGFGHYALREPVLCILEDFFLCSRYLDLHRLPELFCGLTRRPGEGPTLYPVACSPQAWAAGSIFLFLQAATGLTIDAEANAISFYQPRLPPSLHELELRNITIGDAHATILIKRHANDTGVEVISRTGDIKVLVLK